MLGYLFALAVSYVIADGICRIKNHVADEPKSPFRHGTSGLRPIERPDPMEGTWLRRR